ncbi:MAG: DNA polymerase IV [Clostridiales bacterium]|nr:DNA polymerase IV [Clostridiales bacterium]
MDRTILHCDMNNFFASVELLSLPELRGKPVAVCGNPENRHGIVLAKSQEAKAMGVVTAETVWQAKKKCPGLILIPPHHKEYSRYSKMINEIYARFTDQVEPFSIDESWLDVTASRTLFGDGKTIADRIRKEVKEELGLTLSVGVSFNKIFAKMGSDYKKPDATTVITRENYKDLLWPLPAGDLFTLGKATAARMETIGIHTIGDLARTDRAVLASIFGKAGEQLYDYANGLEHSPVAHIDDHQMAKSVGNGVTFRRNLETGDDIRTAVTALSDTVAARLRKQQVKCGGVKVDIKDPYFKTITRQKQLDVPTNLAEEISHAALQILRESWQEGKPIRLLTITGINLCREDEAEQMSLFAEKNARRQRTEQAERAMDSIRQRFGNSSITFGRVLKNDLWIGRPTGHGGPGDENDPEE